MKENPGGRVQCLKKREHRRASDRPWVEVDLAENGALAVEKVKKCRQALTSGFVHDIALSYIG